MSLNARLQRLEQQTAPAWTPPPPSPWRALSVDDLIYLREAAAQVKAGEPLGFDDAQRVAGLLTLAGVDVGDDVAAVLLAQVATVRDLAFDWQGFREMVLANWDGLENTLPPAEPAED